MSLVRRLPKHRKSAKFALNPVDFDNLIDQRIANTIRLMRDEATRIDDVDTRERWLDALQTFARTGDIGVLLRETEWRRKVVPMDEFLYGATYLNLERGSLYPKIEEALHTIDEGDFNEVILMGALGIGKTFLSNIGIVRDVYKLSCMRNPQTSFGIQGKSFITFTVQSVRFSTAKIAIFSELGGLINASPYFQKVFPYDRKISSRMVFPEHRIQIMPATSSTTSIISMNVIGGMLDEANFMQKIVKSKSQFADEQGEFDQAKELFKTLADRRKTRFNKRGKMPGRLYLASSSRYPTDFTEERAKRAEMYGGHDPRVFVYKYSQWEGKPRSSFMKEEFRVQIGNENFRSKVLEANEPPAMGCRVLNVPMDFYQEFLDDPDKSIRDFGGETVLAVNPFIARRETIQQAFELGAKYGYRHPYRVQETDLREGVPLPLLDMVRKDVPSFRVAHIDLGLKKDAAGLAIGHVAGFKVAQAISSTGESSLAVLPVIGIDAVMRIVPPRNGEIDFSDVRLFLTKFRDETGIDLKYVTTDGFQSADTRQILRKQGFITDYQSVESVESYRTLRDTVYDGRLLLAEHLHLAKELRELEVSYHNNKEKVDHPSHGSKDVADAVCGVVQFLMRRRSTWSHMTVDKGPGYHLLGNFDPAKGVVVETKTAEEGDKQEGARVRNYIGGNRKVKDRKALSRRKVARK